MTARRDERSCAPVLLAGVVVFCSLAFGCQSTHEFLMDTSKTIRNVIGRPDVAQAAKAVKSPDPDIRRQAVLELGRGGVRDAQTLGNVLALLMLVLRDDEEALVRAAAASSLGFWQQQVATMPLVAALKDESAMVRQEVTRSLGKTSDPEAVPALIVTLQMDPSAEVRSAAAEALGGFERDDIAEVLVEALGDRSLAVRYAASRGLTKVTGKNYGLDKQRWAAWLASTKRGSQGE